MDVLLHGQHAHRAARAGLAAAAALLLAACGSLRLPLTAPVGSPTSPPPERPRAAAAAPQVSAPRELPPALARIEPLAPGSVPGLDALPPGPVEAAPTQTGIASWYGRAFQGRRTASGERFDMHALTAAHRTLPLPSYALVRNPANDKQVIVRINDRGPFKRGRIVDLSWAAAQALGISGLATVELRPLTIREQPPERDPSAAVAQDDAR
ncbi:MAG: septal ring lytic transglycosylase RlpA family protein [Piscinibacter sp.]|nr:septal ring lytic transglycosylase RlpA family protein [Piscinibacter sp.]